MIRKPAKKILNHFDRLFNVDSFKYIQRVKSVLFGSCGLKAPVILMDELKKKAQALIPPDGKIKLHLGCGKNHFEGYINIDLRETSATDLECDITCLPFDDNTAELIETYHVIEHLPRYDLPRALKEWFRVLKKDGKLVIECPDFDRTVMEYLEGNVDRIDNIFGLQRFPGDAHLFGYNFMRLKKNLVECGFRNIQQCEPRDYHKDLEPCLRVEAFK
jgi:predicted SAM-dependent methyltransferase